MIISNIPENSKVFVYTLHGKHISVITTLSKFTLNISKLESGAYFLEIRIDNIQLAGNCFIESKICCQVKLFMEKYGIFTVIDSYLRRRSLETSPSRGVEYYVL